jgi:glycosyltransferase involved in cell wall biosynthesis
MTKLIIQMPAYNEEQHLGFSLSQLPRQLPGIDTIEWLVINDGSTDNTVKVAKESGADHVVSLIKNQGLAKAFMAGIDRCLELGADIIVNTDADNQYCADDIIKLVEPILKGEAEIVIGERPISAIKHFSFVKKILQKIGSRVVRLCSATDIPDAPSGFRAISRNAAMRLNVFGEYTYTLEMIIQAGKQGISITSVPIRTNKFLRPSKLMKSIPSYIKNSIVTMLRVRNTYKPMNFFIATGVVPIILGAGLIIRWGVLFMGKTPGLHIPSLILASILILIGVQLMIFGLIADLISVNRKILEDIQIKTRKNHYNK